MVGPQTGRYLYHTPWVDTNEYIGYPKPVGITDGTIIGQVRKKCSMEKRLASDNPIGGTRLS